MKLVEITEIESEKLFREVLVELTRIFHEPFRKFDNNPWHLISRDSKHKVKVDVHLINDNGDNYIDLKISRPSSDIIPGLQGILKHYQATAGVSGTRVTNEWGEPEEVRNSRWNIWFRK